MKLSILMPTYNDADTIIESLNSVKMQKSKNWELIIVNDGSTDKTEAIVKDYIKKNDFFDQIKYVYQENQDQLRAILHGSDYISGDYVMFLHSDDLLYDENVVDNIFLEFENNKDVDALLHNLVKIDKDGNTIGEQKVKKYKKSKFDLPLMLLFLGRNIYIDVFIAKKAFFFSNIKDNYLTWNCPFWFDSDKINNIPNIINSSFKYMKYRIYNNNYINNNLGKLNVINGELRTATTLMAFYNIPFHKLQFYNYRVFNKLNINYPVYFQNKQFKHKSEIIKFILDKRFENCTWMENIFLKSLYLFYKNQNSRTITIPKIADEEKIYLGCDMRGFNKSILNNSLTDLYTLVLTEMQKGFSKVIVKSGDLEKVKNILKFLCIDKFVTIEGEY